MEMQKVKRIRVVFKDDEILSEVHKLDGLTRCWVLFIPQENDTVSDVVSHLLRLFQLENSCPDGLILSISGFVLPPFESSCILKDDEVVSIRKKKKKTLLIEGNHAANGAANLIVQEKNRVDNGILRLDNGEFEKEKSGYESDGPEDESEEVDEEVPFRDRTNPGCSNVDPRNRKRKADEKLSHPKKKKHSGEGGCADEDAPGKLDHLGKADVLIDEDVLKPLEKKDTSDHENNIENVEESKSGVADAIKRNSEGEENEKDTPDSKHVLKFTKKGSSRSARRKNAKRRWLREMAKIRKQNATCESEGLRNWKEDKAKSENNKQKWKSILADPETNLQDDQPKGLLHWKPSSSFQNGQFVKGKKRGRNKENLYMPLFPADDVEKSKNQISDENAPQPVVNGTDVQCLIPGYGDADEQPTPENRTVEEHQNAVGSDEENEVVPIVIRPGHIRFEPLGEEKAFRKSPVRLENYQWNGITSKRKGQKWGQENRFLAPKIDSITSNEDDYLASCNAKPKQTDIINFDKLPSLSGFPKEGDVIAYRILELSSTWTPELCDFRVGKVSRLDVNSNEIEILPVAEFPIYPEYNDKDEALHQPDNSLYKEDGSLEIDFSSLVDVRIVKRVSLGTEEKGFCQMSGGVSECNENDKKTSGTEESHNGNQTHASEHNEIDIWEQLSEAISAKKQLLQTRWSENSEKQSSGNQSWSYKALRSSALGPTMAILRSKKDI